MTCFKCKRGADECGCANDGAVKGLEKVPLQHCPACDTHVAETPGCVSVLCVCGKYFEWSAK